MGIESPRTLQQHVGLPTSTIGGFYPRIARCRTQIPLCLPRSRENLSSPTLDLEEGNVPIAAGMDDGTNKEQENAEAEGWMDLDQYQREQSIEGGEIGDRLPGAVQDAELDSDLDMEDNAPKKPLDKEARKEEKRRRNKEEKRKKNELRKAGQLAD